MTSRRNWTTPVDAAGSSRLRVVTAMCRLLGLLVRGVLVAPLAVLAELDPVGIVLLVLQGGVVAPLADAARQRDYFFHASLFGWGKEKSLGSLGAVNTSRGSELLPIHGEVAPEGAGGASLGDRPDEPYDSTRDHHDRRAARRPDRGGASEGVSPAPRARRPGRPGYDPRLRPFPRRTAEDP